MISRLCIALALVLLVPLAAPAPGVNLEVYLGYAGTDTDCLVQLTVDRERQEVKLDLLNPQPDGERCQGWSIFPIETQFYGWCYRNPSYPVWCEGYDPVFGDFQTVQVNLTGDFRATNAPDEWSTPDVLTGHVSRDA